MLCRRYTARSGCLAKPARKQCSTSGSQLCLGHKELPPLPLDGPRLATCSGVSQQWCVPVRAVEHYTAAGPAQHTKQASGSEHGAQPVQPAGCVVTVVA